MKLTIQIIRRLCGAAALCAVLAGVNPAHAQTTNTNQIKTVIGKSKTSAEFEGKLKQGEFSGKVTAVDMAAKTIDLQSLSRMKDGTTESHGIIKYHVTPETKFFKGDQPALLDSLVVGDEVKYGCKYPKPGNHRTDSLLLTFVRVTSVPDTKRAPKN